MSASLASRVTEIKPPNPLPAPNADFYEFAADLGGEAGGIHHFMDHLMDGLAASIKNRGTPDVTPELKQTIVEGVLREAGNYSVEQLAQEENQLLVELIRLRSKAKALEAEAAA